MGFEWQPVGFPAQASKPLIPPHHHRMRKRLLHSSSCSSWAVFSYSHNCKGVSNAGATGAFNLHPARSFVCVWCGTGDAKRETWEAFDQGTQMGTKLKGKVSSFPHPALARDSLMGAGELGGWLGAAGGCCPAKPPPAKSSFVQDGCLRGRWDCEGLPLSTGQVSGTHCFLGQLLTLCPCMGGQQGLCGTPSPGKAA